MPDRDKPFPCGNHEGRIAANETRADGFEKALNDFKGYFSKLFSEMNEIKTGVALVSQSQNYVEKTIIPAILAGQASLIEQQKTCAATAHDVKDILEWKNGVNGKDGAENNIDGLIAGKNKAIGFAAAISLVVGMAGHKLGDALNKLWG